MPSGFSATTAVLGIGVVFESDVPQALSAALEVFPNCDSREMALPAPPVYIVLTADHDACTPFRENRVCGKQLRIADDGIKVLADGDRGHANCSFKVDVIGGDLFRETIRTTGLFLATQQGRIPVHASALMVGEHALVLAGRSGSGKSTLALAANRAGLPVLAEDTVFVQLDPMFRVWGSADHIHVFEQDVPPGEATGTRVRAGRVKYALPIRKTRQSAHRAVLCVLVHGGRASLDPLSPEDAVRSLLREPEAGYDLFAASMEGAIRAIASGGCWQLTLSRDPHAAIDLLIEAFNAKVQRQFG